MSYKLFQAWRQQLILSPGPRRTRFRRLLALHLLPLQCRGWKQRTGDLPQISTDERIPVGLWKWNISLSELWNKTSSALKSHPFATSLCVMGGNTLMQVSSKARLYGPTRQNTERDGLIAARWTVYCSLGMSVTKDHSQSAPSSIPAAAPSFLAWFAPMLAIHPLKIPSLQLSETDISGLE